MLKTKRSPGIRDCRFGVRVCFGDAMGVWSFSPFFLASSWFFYPSGATGRMGNLIVGYFYSCKVPS